MVLLKLKCLAHPLPLKLTTYQSTMTHCVMVILLHYFRAVKREMREINKILWQC